MTLQARSALEVGDVALLSNQWSYEMGGTVVASAITAEVARLDPLRTLLGQPAVGQRLLPCRIGVDPVDEVVP
jgi:hypothetical protein